VFYTPVQAVQYLIAAVDKILVEDFDIEGGLSNNEQMTVKVPCAPYQVSKSKWSEEKDISVPRVAILDPACGTGSFGAEIIKYIKNTYFSGARSAFYENYNINEKKNQSSASKLVSDKKLTPLPFGRS
jgi:predicted helicase